MPNIAPKILELSVCCFLLSKGNLTNPSKALASAPCSGSSKYYKHPSLRDDLTGTIFGDMAE
jgi:hypothetical protein